MLNNDLILHTRTAEQVKKFSEHPSHALLLVGVDGIGKTAIARLIGADILGITTDKLEQYPYIAIVSPEKSTISIDTVRQIQHFLQLRTIGKQPIRRLILIEHAGAMTLDAQNALLKILEEPPKDTLIIATVDSQRSLLPTIISRLQAISVFIPNENDIKNFLAANNDDAKVASAYFLSGGLPGLMHALLSSADDHPLYRGVNQAKEILGMRSFERLGIVDSLSKQKDEAKYLIDALLHIAQTGLDMSCNKKDVAQLNQWYKILKETYASREAMLANANTKLALTKLMLSI